MKYVIVAFVLILAGVASYRAGYARGQQQRANDIYVTGPIQAGEHDVAIKGGDSCE